MVDVRQVVLAIVLLSPALVRANGAAHEPAAEEALPGESADAYRQVGAEQVTTVEEVAPARLPFAPDTQRRLTGRQLAERGVQNLAEALVQLPEVTIRPGGRGDAILQVRGGRKGGMLVLIDGMPVKEPYYGTFDPSTIAATDIAELRVSLAPASPLDGPGGPSGVVEVITHAALGKPHLGASALGSTAPSTRAAVTGRGAVASGLGVRVSGGASLDGRDLELTLPDGRKGELDQRARLGHGAVAAQYEAGKLRLGAHAWAAHRIYLVPPTDAPGAHLLLVDGETIAAASTRGDLELGGWLLTAEGFAQILERTAERYTDPSLAGAAGRERLAANTAGARLRTARALGGGLDFTVVAAFDTDGARAVDELGASAGGRTFLGELAAGLDARMGPSLLLRAAGGLAVPTMAGTSPWPEGKLSATWTPAPAFELTAVAAHKGRVPTVRERYALYEGNPTIGAEVTSSGELGARLEVQPWLALRAGGYARLTRGFIRFDDARTRLVNYGDVLVEGLEAGADAGGDGPLGLSATYVLTGGRALSGGATPLENLPRHRVNVSAHARLHQRAGAFVLVRVVGERTDQGQRLEPYPELEGSAWVRVTRDLRATVRASNATDERYRDRADTLAAGRTVSLGLDGVWE